jgi:hypothetical protein
VNASRIKENLRRFLNFVFALFFAGDVRFLFHIIRMGGLGTLSSFVENSFLFECALRGAGEGAIVEIGSHRGRTTVSLAYGSSLKKREKVYAVDPQQEETVKKMFLENIQKAGAAPYVLPIFKKSEEAAKDFSGPVRLLFIDGCHEYDYVKNDILSWKKFLKDGAIIALHDYLADNSPHYLAGVCRAVGECIIDNPEFVVEGTIDSIFFASWKKTDESNKRIFEHFRQIEKSRVFLKAKLDQTILQYDKKHA